MSKYKQASLKKKMRTVARALKSQKTGQHGDHWIEPSKQKNSSGQRRARRREANNVVD